MNQFLRFSVSGLLGFFISAALFVGMLSLLKGRQNQVKSQDTQINFSFVKAFEQAEVKPTPKRIKPEPQEVSQAPSMPSIAMDNPLTPVIDLPSRNQLGHNLKIVKGMPMPGLGGTYGGNGIGNNLSGTIKTAIAPMYPQKELIAKSEGWVKVLITINEFGSVSDVNVLQAKPARAFNAAAIKAVKKWKFHPKVEAGKAMPFQVTQTIEFKLDQ